MARRAGSGMLGRIRKRFVALAVGLLALGFVYASSRRATKAIHARTGGGKRDPGVTDASIQWTNFFGSNGGEEAYGQDDGASVEPEGDGGRAAVELAEEQQVAPEPEPEPVAPTPPATPSNSRKPQPSPSNSPAGTPSGTPAATSPPPTASKSGKPVPSSPAPTTSPTSTKSGAPAKVPEPKKEGSGAAAAATPAPKKLAAVPQSQMQAAGDFLAPEDVYVPPHAEQTLEERKASPRYDAELDYDFKDTAYVTMAAGEEAGRQVIGLVSSLRASKTRVQDIVVMLSRGGVGSSECRGDDGGAWKRKHKREGVQCSGPDTVAEEIIGTPATDALRKLGAVLLIVDPIPSTQYTEGIPGGRSFFWCVHGAGGGARELGCGPGAARVRRARSAKCASPTPPLSPRHLCRGMALNKLRVFNMTQYKKVIWMDSDTMVLQVRETAGLQANGAGPWGGGGAAVPVACPHPSSLKPSPFLSAAERGQPVQGAHVHGRVYVRVLQPQRTRDPVGWPVGAGAVAADGLAHLAHDGRRQARV
jgi:hypothetical protein